MSYRNMMFPVVRNVIECSLRCWRSGHVLSICSNHSVPSRAWMRKYSAQSSPVYKDLDFEPDPEQLFIRCWERLERRLGSSILTPRELIFLNGPPGSGKGANMPFIKRIRGLSYSVVVSSLLARRPEISSIVESGGLVSDESVCDVVLEALFDPIYTSQAGCIVDGFPRSTTQVSFLEYLLKHLNRRYTRHAECSELRTLFPRPSFKVVVLYIDEATSIARQMARQAKSEIHNAKVREALAGTTLEERGTDKSISKCKKRYQVFRHHYPALSQLQSVMPFSVIDATGSLEDCEAQIAHELRYQSSLDLDERTYANISRVPLAREVVEHSRQHLVKRLDDYQLSHTDVFHKVMAVIINEALPLLYANAMSGHVDFSTSNCVFERHSKAADMFVDVLTDRGFKVSYKCTRIVGDAVRVNTKTGSVHRSPSTRQHSFRISFPGGNVRENSMNMAHVPLAEMRASDETLLTTTICPEGLDHQSKRPPVIMGCNRTEEDHDSALA